MKLPRALLLSGALSLAACLPVGVRTVDGAPGQAAPMQNSDKVFEQIEGKNLKRAEELRVVIQAKTFKQLPGDVQYRDLESAVRLADARGQTKLAYDYIVRVNAMPQATYADRQAQVKTASELGYEADVMAGLTALAQRWPERVADIDDRFIVQSVVESNQRAHGMAFPLLQALYDAHWKLKSGIEPSEAWRDLSLLLLEKNQRARAIDVATHVTDVYVLVAMRADRRFDAVVEADRAQFDIDAAADRQTRDLQSMAENTPKSLELKSRAIEALRIQQHYAAMLAASDAVLLEIESTNFPEKLYDDFEDEYSSFLDDRASALELAGRWDDAVDQLMAASRLHEKGSGNVSQLIDLGSLYCDLGRANEALSAIGDVTAKASGFGDMAMQEVRVDAAVQLGDAKRVSRILKVMSANRKHAPSEYESALIAANLLDRASHWLVERLLDPEQRQEALVSVQTYMPAPSTPREMDLDARWRTVIARQEVQAAIQKIGRVDSYRLVEPP